MGYIVGVRVAAHTRIDLNNKFRCCIYHIIGSTQNFQPFGSLNHYLWNDTATMIWFVVYNPIALLLAHDLF